MCGIAGLLLANRDGTEAALSQMAAGIAHRGPDGEGIWFDPSEGIGLVHRRLAILDLTPAGAQPMHSADNRWVLSFNGEIYNYQGLRRDLESRGNLAWRGHSDTEVLLACFSQWGVAETLRRANGMFALALWDRRETRLYLARDRMGEKPLYIAWLDGGVAFASELKALRAAPGFRAAVDPQALALLTKYGYIPAPHCIYPQCYKLLQGHYLCIDAAQLTPPASIECFQALCHPYWTLAQVARDGLERTWPGTITTATDELDRLLHDAVSIRMVADVPVGAFLSGGIDSSLITAIMQQHSSRPVQTFTIGFHEPQYDESVHAEAIAKHLRTEHRMLRLHADDALSRVQELPQLYDEPFADSSQLPTALLAEFTRRHVTVSLSGDGGDELFLGYQRYFNALNLWSLYRRIPAPARNAAAKLIGGAARHMPGHARRLGRISATLSGQNASGLHQVACGLWPDSVNPALTHSIIADTCVSRVGEAALNDDISRMMYFDQACYLPDDLMVKTDRASMAVALEARMPFLDPALIEFAWRVPASMKRRNNQGKWLLRELLARYVPRPLFERKKQGFGVPVDAWLRGPLQSWAEKLLNEERLHDEGLFDARLVRATWNTHLSGRRDHGTALWHILAMQAWLQDQRDAGIMN